MNKERLQKAVTMHDAQKKRLNRIFETADMDGQYAAIQAEEDALLRLQLAFFQETQDINCLENCLIVGASFIRKMVQT